MSRFFSHINTVKEVIKRYKGDVPFSAFLKNFFSKDKKFGSRDRRVISAFCYHYFRLGLAYPANDLDKRLLAATFLLGNEPNEWLEKEGNGWNEKVNFSLDEKIELSGLNLHSIFPLKDELSSNIDIAAFNRSFLVQPDVFIRIRPKKQSIVKKKLEEAEINYTEISESCFALANGTKLENILSINEEVVIQDLNSQRVAEFFPFEISKEGSTIWDCCAASGGKAIMTFDTFPRSELTVSDIRSSIIINLQKRLKEAGINKFQSFVADLSKPSGHDALPGNKKFDFVICDAPCSGSGTWSRTPEQLLFFKQEEISRYSALQKSIATNTTPFVKKGGYFLYITCSVFKKENEEVVEYLQQNNQLELIKMDLMKGYEKKADTMFAALFKRK